MKLKTCLISIAITLVTSPIYANLNNSNLIATIVIEATRLNKSAFETPQFVEVFSKTDLQDSGSHNIIDALEQNGSIFVRHFGGNNPSMTHISMRGYGENSIGRVLVKSDGEILNNLDMSSSDFSRVPFSSIERIEVLHGPQTVMHGSNASAGMINIITDSSNYDNESYIKLYGGSWGTIGGATGTKGGDEESRVSYYANGAWERSDGYRDFSDYDLYRINGDIKKAFENESFIKLSSFYSNTRYNLPGPLSFKEWKMSRRLAYPDYKYYHYRQNAYGLNFSVKGVINNTNTLKLESSFSQRSDSFRAHQISANYIQNSPFDNYAFNITPQYINTSSLGDFDNEFTLGATVRYDVRKGYNAYTYPSYIWKQKEDQTRWTIGSFLRDEIYIDEKLSIFAGARLERLMTRSESLKRPSRNDNLSAFESGFNFRPVKNSKLFTKFARFYRAPFVDETNYTMGNIVSPERGWSVDVGGEIKLFDDFFASSTLYISETKNEIYYDPFRFDNLNMPGNVRREGLDLRASWEKEKVAAISIGYGLVNAVITDGEYDNKKVCAVPRHQAALNSRIYIWDDFFIRGSCRYTSEQYTISDFKNEFRKLKGYPVFSIGFQYECPYKPFEGLQIAFDINNLFDRNYCDYATYGENFYPAAGRSYTITLQWTF